VRKREENFSKQKQFFVRKIRKIFNDIQSMVMKKCDFLIKIINKEFISVT
jgi:hypothetical protein